MSKICPNCNKIYEEGKFCLICGTPLVENVASKPSAGSSLNLGDANAISGGVNVSDNHSVNQNTVNTTTHNVDSHNVINNHITQVAKEKTPEEVRLENMKIFRKACQDVFQDGVQTSEEKRRLDELQFQLGLDEETAAHIVESVRSTSARKSAVLGPVQQITFNNIKTAILNNRTDMINRLLPQLKAMVQKFSAEDLQYTYYMLQAIMAPESCVKDYERPHEDKYWQTFWSSVAYRRIGDIEHSEMLVVDVGDKWIDTIPQENVYVLATVNALIDGDMAIAKSLYDQITGEHSNLLSVLVGCLYPLIYHDMPMSDDVKKMISTGKFYTENLFKVISDKVEEQKQALAEAKRKAEEEIARQKAEEERKRKEAEEERKRKEEAEAKRKAEEERKRKEEKERKRKEEEAEQKRQAEEKTLYALQQEARKEEAEAKRKAEEERKRKEEKERKRKEEEAEQKRQAEEKTLYALQQEARKEEAERLSHWPKFCNKCGNPLTPGQKFCNKCGNRIIINS